MQQQNTSWQRVGKWYSGITKDKGHYYHEHVIIPGVLRLLNLQKDDSLLDLACGSGVLGRAIPKDVSYIGVDIATSLIQEARRQDKNQKHQYTTGDITKELSHVSEVRSQEMDTCACILALQNVENFQKVFENAAKFLRKNGVFVLVLNHPSFRIPRQSSWGIDEQNKLQYRRVNRYLSPLKIPITMHPSTSLRMNFPSKQTQGKFTWSFHHPLSEYVTGLANAGFVITGMEEWASDKESEGKAKKMENHSRAEIPLFMAIRAQKMQHVPEYS